MATMTLPAGLHYMKVVAAYAQTLLKERTGKLRVEEMPACDSIGLVLRGELETMVGRVNEAWSNRGLPLVFLHDHYSLILC